MIIWELCQLGVPIPTQANTKAIPPKIVEIITNVILRASILNPILLLLLNERN